LEKDNNIIQDAFIFHYKNASNTLPWMNDQYNYYKTIALDKFLNLFQLQKRILGD
jgi:hypothetical protein